MSSSAVRGPRLRRCIAWMGLAFVGAISGCSTLQLGYNNADTLIHWRGGRYFGFEDEQKAEFERRVQRFLAWHRKTELPHYARLSHDMADRLSRGLSQADLVWSYDAIQRHLRQAMVAGSGEMSELLDALSAAQVERFRLRLEKENSDFAKEHGLREAPEERRARRVKRNVERMEDWFGSLTDAQVDRVVLYSKRAPLDDEFRDRDRRRMQREIIAMLKAKEARKHLAQWASAWEQNRDPAYEAARKANLQELYAMLLDVDKTLSPEQRARAVKRLRGFAGDFVTLAAAQGAR